MFCYQCEQAAKGTGCDAVGVCGKKPDIAALQDIIVYQLKGIGYLAHLSRELGKTDEEINEYTLKALFTTVTNVDFDSERLIEWIISGRNIRKKAANLLNEAATTTGHTTGESEWPLSAKYEPKTSLDELVNEANLIEGIGILTGPENEDIRSLQQLLIYGLKGLAAYADHAAILGKTDDTVFAFIHEALAKLNDHAVTIDDLVGLNMKCGEINIRAMELLDEGHTGRFGHPEPAHVSTGKKKGPAIVISGHDLVDLEVLLQQTEGTGVNVYTHGEMLPAHGYPGYSQRYAPTSLRYLRPEKGAKRPVVSILEPTGNRDVLPRMQIHG